MKSQQPSIHSSIILASIHASTSRPSVYLMSTKDSKINYYPLGVPSLVKETDCGQNLLSQSYNPNHGSMHGLLWDAWYGEKRKSSLRKRGLVKAQKDTVVEAEEVIYTNSWDQERREEDAY